MALTPKNGARPGAPRPLGLAPQDARAREEAERQDRHRTEELNDACAQVEEDLEQVKGRYELYFLGVERREPARERDELKRRVARLKGEFTRNTGLRFRIETLHARYLSYERMWTRNARQKEDGTYRRDLLRARRHAERQRHEEARTPAAPPGSSGDQAAAAAPAVPATAPTPSAAATPPPAPGAATPVPIAAMPSEEQLRALYGAYVEAKRRCNEDVSRLSFEAVARAVQKQVPELLAKHNARSVEFKVVVKDGRAVLKAVPRS